MRVVLFSGFLVVVWQSVCVAQEFNGTSFTANTHTTWVFDAGGTSPSEVWFSGQDEATETQPSEDSRRLEDCPEGWSGENCNVNSSSCFDHTCLNGAICTEVLQGFECTCAPGFEGERCEVDIDECQNSPCMHGVCINAVGSFQCFCRPGYTGDFCDREFDECLSHPCQNGATCHNIVNGYECECHPGFTGTDCEIDIDECASQPCQNNATCIDAVAAFSCNCMPGFTDELCSTNIDECEPKPCLNGGICADGINSYTCNCDDTGFKGHHCESNIDDCLSAPCQHGSSCQDLVKDYQCECFDGYTGKDCEVDIEECSSVPCQNNGTCLERSNVTLYEMNIFQNFSYEEAAGFICQCIPGFTGDVCEINIDECASSPCLNGDCIDLINSYRCQCFPGYEGENCDLEIDECVRYAPCVQGSCEDQVADYNCKCHEGYGGKNCSVALIGCINVECQNDGLCEALLYNEVNHDFLCHCMPGFTGRYCADPTTMSFNGSSYLIINSERLQEYEMALRFRTTLRSGIMAVGKGETYFTLALDDGRVNLQSSLLNEWNGISAGAGLNTGNWVEVSVFMNDSYVTLRAGDDKVVHPVLFNDAVNSTFVTTLVGGITQNLATLTENIPFFVGCVEDIAINGEVTIPSVLPNPLKVNIVDGCPRVEQCAVNPCMNEGLCVDLWTSFKCDCARPYLGETCRLSFTPATFGNENARNSLIMVEFPEEAAEMFSTFADISLLLRTRDETGLIFYLGQATENEDTFFLAELVNGKVVIKIKLDEQQAAFTVPSPKVNDGNTHLLQVVKHEDTLEVYINSKLQLNKTLSVSGTLYTAVMYLGGTPSLLRSKRQLGVANPNANRSFFKGILQDIRLSNGSSAWVVQPFPITTIPGEGYILPGNLLNITVMENVLAGIVSDDTCSPDPCQNGATCAVTWNDFTCSCPFGFKGKTCSVREYCVIHKCPGNSSCINLDDGYECVTNITMNGKNSSLSYIPKFHTIPDYNISTATINFRSMFGGALLHIQSLSHTYMWVGLGNEFLKVIQVNGTRQSLADYKAIAALDGDWHELTLHFQENSFQVLLDKEILNASQSSIEDIVDFKGLVLNGQTTLGSLPKGPTSLSLVDPTIDRFSGTNNELHEPEDGHHDISNFFRGCFGPTRIGGILLPFFSPEDLLNNTAANTFERQDEEYTEEGCTVCFTHECLNGGYCDAPKDSFICSCPPGFEGDLCEVNIDECLNHTCFNEAICVDGINSYMCHCLPGYTGQFCEEDINECTISPCMNGATCIDEIAHFQCICTEEYIGMTCNELKVKNCSRAHCENGASCQNILNNEGVADDYECVCLFGFEGRNCENTIDFCTLENIHCVHGYCSLVFKNKGWECTCDSGYEGEFCEKEIDECSSHPCKNGGTCIDGFRSYTCICAEGWEGTVCKQDVDECQHDPLPCHHGGTCINFKGGFECKCTYDYCGQTCSLTSPCLSANCSNGGTCHNLCDENISVNNTRPTCACTEGWKGDTCEDMIEISNQDLVIIIASVAALMLLIIFVGLAAFVMMAKKKRATRGTYSPSRQEFYSPRVEMGNIMKPPPEERLI